MVVYLHFRYLRAIPVLVLLALPARAEDWRERLREGSQAGVAAPELGETDGGILAYAGSLRGGYNSNANADFDPVPSAFLRGNQALVVNRPLGQARAGLQLRGAIEAPFAAEHLEYGDLEARTGLAGRLAGRELAGTAGYRFEDDNGLRSHDIGARLAVRTPVGGAAHFLTATVNSVTYEPLAVTGGMVDLGDNDRLRLGLETGVDFPLAPGIEGSVSAGLVDMRYARRVDLAGFERDSTSVFLRAGATFATGPLTGGFGVMAFRRNHDEALFETASLMLADADLSWRLGERTTLGFRFLSDLEETPVYGAGSEHTTIAAVTLAQGLSETLTATLSLYREHVDYLETPREERTRGAALELSHALGSGLSLALGGEYETVANNLVEKSVKAWKVSAGFDYAFSR